MLLFCGLESADFLFCGPEHLHLDSIFEACLDESGVIADSFLALPEEFLIGGWDGGDFVQSRLEVGEGLVKGKVERVGLTTEGDSRKWRRVQYIRISQQQVDNLLFPFCR